MTWPRLVWCLAVYGTCAYAVFWLDRSGWWFLLAMIISSGVKFDFSTKQTKP